MRPLLTIALFTSVDVASQPVLQNTTFFKIRGTLMECKQLKRTAYLSTIFKVHRLTEEVYTTTAENPPGPKSREETSLYRIPSPIRLRPGISETMNNPVFSGGYAGAAGGGDAAQSQDMLAVKSMQTMMESCPVKTVMAGTMGFALGGAFGLFMASMAYDTPLTPQGAAITSLPMKEQLKRGLKDMGQRSFSSAKNFGKVGAIFAGTECCIEGFRAKNVLSNGVMAGCITGGVLAAPAGPQAAAIGCGGFAAFSAAIDWYMRRPSEEE